MGPDSDNTTAPRMTTDFHRERVTTDWYSTFCKNNRQGIPSFAATFQGSNVNLLVPILDGSETPLSIFFRKYEHQIKVALRQTRDIIQCSKEIENGEDVHQNNLNVKKEPNEETDGGTFVSMEHENVNRGNSGQYPCDQCDYVAREELNLKIHKDARHVLARHIFACDQCEYIGVSKSDVGRHVKNKHEGVNCLFSCGQCDYIARRKDNLKQHQKVHSKDVYNCEQCDFIGTSKIDVTSHVKSQHEGVNYTFSCDQCSYGCNTKSHLNRHRRAQHEGILFSCDQCDFVANYKITVTRHAKSKHGNGERHPCNHCDYIAKRKDNLRSHIKLKHEPMADVYNVNNCEECDYMGATKMDLARHINSKHKDINNVFCCRDCTYTSHTKNSFYKHRREEHFDTLIGVDHTPVTINIIRQQESKIIAEDEQGGDDNLMDSAEDVGNTESIIITPDIGETIIPDVGEDNCDEAILGN